MNFSVLSLFPGVIHSNPLMLPVFQIFRGASSIIVDKIYITFWKYFEILDYADFCGVKCYFNIREIQSIYFLHTLLHIACMLLLTICIVAPHSLINVLMQWAELFHTHTPPQEFYFPVFWVFMLNYFCQVKFISVAHLLCACVCVCSSVSG